MCVCINVVSCCLDKIVSLVDGGGSSKDIKYILIKNFLFFEFIVLVSKNVWGYDGDD